MKHCAGWLISTVALLTVSGAVPPTVPPLPQVIEAWSGQHAQTSAASTHVVRTPEEWRSVWRLVGRSEPRPFDPAKEIAVAVFLGERRTGGFAVDIVETAIHENQLIVRYREKTPAPGRMVAQIITSPWTITALSASNLAVTFRALPSKPAVRP